MRLQISVVVGADGVSCRDSRLVPVIGNELTLEDATSTWTVHTSSIGGFQFDRIPPGTYRLSISPASARDETAEPLRFAVDLSDALFGPVIRLDCPDAPPTLDSHIRRLDPPSTGP